jgi:MFS family permease
MGGFGMITLIPVIARSWTVEFATASLTITFYMAPFILIQIFSGAIAQLFEVRKTLLFGFAMYTLGALLSGMSPNLWTLLGSRILQGIGAGFLTPVIMALIGDLVSEEHVGKAVGLLGVAYTVGVTLGPLISGVMEVHQVDLCLFHGRPLVSACFIDDSDPRWQSMGRPDFANPFLFKPRSSRACQPAAASVFLYVGIMTFGDI